jgi:hypothetical protein
MVGVTSAAPIDHEDPVHKERLARYDRNIGYYQEAQYEAENLRALEVNDFLSLRVNYTSVIRRSVDMKSDWLFGIPVGIRGIPLDENGVPKEGQKEDTAEIKKMKARVARMRKYNHLDFWDWVMCIMGKTCGDFFVLVEAQADDEVPSISLQDPSYVFPDYPENVNLPMRACQIQYVVDREGAAVDEESLSTVRITEDYRLELKSSGGSDVFDELDVLDDRRLTEYVQRVLRGENPEDLEITCVYRKFEDDNMVEGSKRDLGVPVIPIVHGRNKYIWNTRYGDDDVGTLIPKTEKYNEMFYYAERVARINAHAKLFLSGVRKEDGALRTDFDDVIYGGENSSATVLTMNTDTAVMQFVTDALDRELHLDAHIPPIAEGEAESGFGATPSGLALLIRYGPLQAVTNRAHNPYADALSATYMLALIFDEMVIKGKQYGAEYKYDTWAFDYDWCNMMPQAIGEIISDMSLATGGKQILSTRTAQERIPGIDPETEQDRLQDEIAKAAQLSLESPLSPSELNGNGLPAFPVRRAPEPAA